jgi:hypothetical protein
MKASDVVDLLNKVEVDCYGTMTPLPQLSTVTIKDDTLVLVRPHDPSQFPALVYAIRTAMQVSNRQTTASRSSFRSPPPVSDPHERPSHASTCQPHLGGAASASGHRRRLRSELRSSSQPRRCCSSRTRRRGPCGP